MSEKNSIISKLPGVKIYKSFGEAFASVSENLEKQHLATFARVKKEQRAAKAKLSKKR